MPGTLSPRSVTRQLRELDPEDAQYAQLVARIEDAAARPPQ